MQLIILCFILRIPCSILLHITTLPTLEKTALSECAVRLDDNRRWLVALVMTEIASKGNVETDYSTLASEKDALAVDNEVEVHCRAWIATN